MWNWLSVWQNNHSRINITELESARSRSFVRGRPAGDSNRGPLTRKERWVTICDVVGNHADNRQINASGGRIKSTSLTPWRGRRKRRRRRRTRRMGGREEDYFFPIRLGLFNNVYRCCWYWRHKLIKTLSGIDWTHRPLTSRIHRDVKCYWSQPRYELTGAAGHERCHRLIALPQCWVIICCIWHC